jgi:collagen type III alpha
MFGGDNLFRVLDADGDGKISRDELYAAAINIKKLDRNNDGDITRDEVGPPQMAGGPQPGRPGEGGFRPTGEMMLKQLDKDNDGKISKDEAPERMREGFARVDTNNDGFLDQAELGRMFAGFQRPGGQPGQPGQPGGEMLERMRQMYKDADKNGDGKLSKDEAPDRLKERFADVDKNSDGFIDQQEQMQAVGAFLRNRGEGDQPRRRPDGDRKPDGERRPDGDKKPEGDRKPDSDKKPEGDKKPE